ncbi:TetR/AcrR family transcriptional regulator [Pseudoduganella ginsengisoli]|uniref:TetR family transcriptional regulator n=1 Tax=Pseudoduganella ginsengisoli TaxID=1462440 RepID=A0A6L6Q3U1_9BURK|nr:TetR/AcrR family transcriptional regulator [Pseudoduganella ginsengisoli]MTW04350.1 TetR family transcriptional regulator [Pseudoduganella ginsengisoli]
MSSKTAPPILPASTGAESEAAPRRRGRPAKSEQDSLRGELIRKSAHLFRTQGYDNTTVRDIAAAAGIHSGSWFYHFKSKQEILAAVMEHGMHESLARIEEIAPHTLPPRAALHRLVEVHLHNVLAPNHDFIPVLLYEWRSLDQPSRERIIKLKDRYEAVWDEVIDRLHTSGDWAMPTRFDRLLMFGALSWTAQWYKPGRTTLEDLAAQAVQFILRTPAKA